MAGGDRDRLAEAERVELGGERLLLGPVDLVGDDDDGQVAAAQNLRDLGIALAQPGARVEDERDGVGVGDRCPRLRLDLPRERILGLEIDAAGVDQLEPHAVPLALQSLAVAGDTRLLVNDGLTPADQAVDQRRLADVREADHSDASEPRRGGSRGHHPSPRSRASSTTRATTSSMLRPVVSSSTASAAATIAPCSRSRSR